MSEKEEIKVRLSTVICIIIIFILIIALGVVYYLGFVKEDTNKESIISNNEKSQTQLKEENKIDTNTSSNTENKKEESKEKEEDNKDNSNYLKNMTKSVSKELGNANEICADSFTKGDLGVESVYVNSKAEAYARLKEDSKLYKKYGEEYKLSDNVANVYDYKMGNGINEYIFLLKTDGSVNYIYLNMDDNNKITIKKLKEVKDVTNIIQISGNDAEGIGGYGVLFITSDGNCLPYFDM